MNTFILSSPTALAEASVKRFVQAAKDAILQRDTFSVALAGGSTPKAMYRLLASEEFSNQLDWNKIFVFFGDERCVLPDDPESNYRMTREAFLDHVPIPEENILPMDGALEPEKSALLYEHKLRNHFGNQPRLDLVLLGMGTDGHTASLFPGTAAIHENNRWVVAHFVSKLDAWRLTLTPPIINSARQIIFLVSGKNKAQPLYDVLHGPRQPDVLPSQIIQPTKGSLTWMLDAAAAKLLAKR